MKTAERKITDIANFIEPTGSKVWIKKEKHSTETKMFVCYVRRNIIVISVQVVKVLMIACEFWLRINVVLNVSSQNTLKLTVNAEWNVLAIGQSVMIKHYEKWYDRKSEGW